MVFQLLCSAIFINSWTAEASATPWQLSSNLNFPEWLTINIEHRSRYETLDQQYRAVINGVPANGGDQALVFRTLLHTRFEFEQIHLGVELMDSRIALADSGTATASQRLTTTIANPIELLQAYVEVPVKNLLLKDSQALFRAGRITMDVGSRRLVARNRYRNTINAFTGIDWQWQYQQHQFRAFYTLPIQRRVNGDIIDSKPRFEAEHPKIRFWGLHYTQPIIDKQNKIEFYLFGVDEDDTKNRATNNREHYTIGVRIWRKPYINSFDYQLENVYQIGQSRSSKTATTNLDHLAHFHHLEIGYSFAAHWSPRLLIQYDYASGDDNPDDNNNNRFDTLYGARRFDFGPTSIYGAVARSNINSPGIRLILKPHQQLSTMFSLRGFWRASTTDAWITSGINGSHPYIGTQIEGSIRWDLLADNLRLETGFVHLFSGGLMTEADKDDSTYAYLQAIIKF
jgi:hypothetical protein